MGHERRPPMVPSSASRYHRRRSSGTRDERYRSGESAATFSTAGHSCTVQVTRGMCERTQSAFTVCVCVCVADVHTEAVQAALAKHKERKVAVPMPSKRRSLVVQTSMDAYTPPGESQPRPFSSHCTLHQSKLK